MNQLLNQVNTNVYEKCDLTITDFKIEKESKEYDACQFKLNELHVVCRNSKITPKKVGQFVTFWKRKLGGPIEPFESTDAVDYFVVNVQFEDKMGQFVFPTSILIAKGIISTDQKEGKRAFRVYPSWDVTLSKQAVRTQKWQSDYFFEITPFTDFKKVKKLYGNQ